jgi:CheY-like chemotaxis protein
VRHASGATVLPSGRVALVLNAANLVRSALGRPPARGLAPALARPARAAKQRVLVAEDSVTTRTLGKSILEAAGYEVAVAPDGAAAWDLLQERGADLLVSDVEMPRMDGIALTEAVRASKRFRDLPVVLVTARATEPAGRRRCSACWTRRAPWSSACPAPPSPPDWPTGCWPPRPSRPTCWNWYDRAGDPKREKLMARILVVEDSPTQAQELRLILESEGFAVDTVPDGRGVPERLRAAPFDLVLSDVLMPWRSALDAMGRQVRHLGRLPDGLPDSTRLTRGLVLLRRDLLDLARLARTAAEDRRRRLEQDGLALTVEVPETPVWVAGDAAGLLQVLDNLLDNAAKFTDPGGRVAVGLAADPARGQAVLTVRDSGMGIDPERLPRLSEPGTQAGRGLGRPRGGLGLGLSVVKGLVELHAGQVQAASAGPGTGAEFTVRLPLEPEPAALAGAPVAPGPAGKRLKVVVIEDNRDTADSLQLLLVLQGHEVRVAYTGPEGLKAASEACPDVVLSDIGLPGLDGYAVAAALRREPATAQARLIAVSGYGAEEDRRRSREAGFDFHLVKPVEPEQLLRLLTGGRGPSNFSPGAG